ncbi:MAG: hypothetical protein ACI9MR_003426 [Myxococcota bacterium]|jgi:hypothetical protein
MRKACTVLVTAALIPLVAACASQRHAPPVLSDAVESCGSGSVEVRATAPKDAALVVKCPTLGVAAQTIAAGTTWQKRFAISQAGLHVCVPYDATGQHTAEGLAPFAVLDGEHHAIVMTPDDGYTAIAHRIRRCEEGSTTTIRAMAKMDPWSSNWFLSADKRHAARFDQYIKSGGISAYLATVTPGKFERLLITESDAAQPTLDEAGLAVVSDELRTRHYRRITTEATAVKDFNVTDGRVRTRVNANAGETQLPPYPVTWIEDQACCPLEAASAVQLAPDGLVFGTLEVHCQDREGCDEATYGSPDSYQQIAIELTPGPLKP